MIIVNNNNFDFIAGRGPESHSRMNQDFSWFLLEIWEFLQASLAISLKIKDKWRKSFMESYLKIRYFKKMVIFLKATSSSVYRHFE